MSKNLTIFTIDKSSSKAEQLLEWTFVVSILFKLAFGAVEAAAGFALLIVSNSYIDRVIDQVNSWVIPEWSVGMISAMLANQRLFLAWYAILHGIPKVILALVLIRRKLWGYPLSLAILIGFILYQVYEIIGGRSLLFMISITIFDLFVGYMIIHEWRRDKIRFAKKQLRDEPAGEHLEDPSA